MQSIQTQIIARYLLGAMSGEPVPDSDAAELRELVAALHEVARPDRMEFERAEAYAELGMAASRLVLAHLKSGLLAERELRDILSFKGNM